MAANTFLELTHNPFTPPRHGFYPGADRKTHLEHIRHLSQWSRRVLLVTGPFGIGKSTLFRELSSTLEPGVRGARLSGTLVNSERDVLLAVAQGFGVAMRDEIAIEEGITLLERYATEQAEAKCTCVIMIDDAQLLDYQAVNTLIKLVGVSRLRMVLFAEATLIANVTRAAKLNEVDWFEIRLGGFPSADVRDYLEWRFAQAQYRGRLPFTDAQLDKIRHRSGGNPNVIDFMANEMLVDLETGEYRRRNEGFPKRHLALAAVLALAVFLLYQLYQQPADPPKDVAAAEENTDLATQILKEMPEVTAPRLDAMPPEPAEEAPAVESDPAADLVEPTASEPDVSVTESEPERVTAQVIEEAEETVASVAESETETTPVAKPETDPAPVSIPARQTVAAAPATVPVETSTPTPPPASAAGVNDGAWLLSQNPDYFTLQLMTLSREQGGIDLIRRQADAGEFAMYRTRRDGRLFHVVTYGLFSSRAAAQTAAGSLDGELEGIRPWIRTLRSVQESVRETSQN